jgi:hypothetical protein
MTISGPDSPLPYLNPCSAVGGGQIVDLAPSQFLAANPRVPGTLTLTLAGTITNGDAVTITFTGKSLPGGAISVTATAAAGDTIETLAEKVAKAINDSAALQNFGVFADDALGVVTVSWPGPLGASCTVTKSVSGSATETVALSSSSFAGGSGPILPYQNFNYAWLGQVLDFRIGIPSIVAPNLVAAMAADNQPFI